MLRSNPKYHQLKPEIRDLILKRDNNACRVCYRVASSDVPIEIHHIHNGKPLHPSNLIALCKSCNSALKKSTLTAALSDCLTRVRSIIGADLIPTERERITEIVTALYKHRTPSVIKRRLRLPKGSTLTPTIAKRTFESVRITSDNDLLSILNNLC